MLFRVFTSEQGTVPETDLELAKFRYIYSEKEVKALQERKVCPDNDKLCQEAVWLTQNMLLGTKLDMEQIADAVRKIQKQSALLAHT